MSFVDKINQRRKADKNFDDGIEMLRAIKVEHGNTILEIFMVALHEGEVREIEDSWWAAKDIRKLPEFFSCFVPTNSNPFFPLLSSDRKNNLSEEAYRIESNYQQSEADKIGLSKDTQESKKLMAGFTRIFTRIDAIGRRANNIKKGNFQEMFDVSLESINERQRKMLLRPNETIKINFGIEIDTHELVKKSDKLISDLEKFRDSEAGKAILEFSIEPKRR